MTRHYDIYQLAHSSNLLGSLDFVKLSTYLVDSLIMSGPARSMP